MANSIDAVKQLQKEIDVFTGQLNEINNKILTISKNTRAVSDGFSKIKTPSGVNSALKQTSGNIETINALYKQQDSLEKNLINTQAKQKLAIESTNKAYIKSRFELQQQNKLVKEAVIISSRYSTELQKATTQRNKLARSIQDLNVKRELGNKLSDKEQSELKQSTAAFTRYDNAIKKAKTSVGRFQENVGNYPKGLKAAASAARGLASAMGLVGGAFLIVSVVKDAFKRIREFDKSMQNLSGILRVSRKDVKDLEAEIISVAKASVRTSTEVATLAESLLTLGKSKEDVKALLAPVTDLSLGLNVAADEAGEFLVQMLNTFGASTDEADKYADTIATIRTSTSLDFQKMRDSFQYLAPISKVLNKDLAYTGALIGILADNGIKAERAGRLLGTAQQKLASEGKSLTDALEEINTASQNNVSELDLLSLSSKLFGKQAASLGVVLASNTDAIDKNAQAIRDNGGALDDLVKEQMESLDSKIKLLDSAWEGLITTVDNGQGAISTYLKGFLDLITKSINKVSDLEQAQSKLGELDVSKGAADYFRRLNPLLLFTDTAYGKAEKAQIKFSESNKDLTKTSLLMVEAQKKVLTNAFNSGELTEKETIVYLNQIRVLESSIKLKKQERKALEEKAIALEYSGQAYTSNGEVLENFYENAAQASTKELKKFISNNEEKLTNEEETNKDIIESRKKAIDILSDLSTLENDVLKDGPQLTNTEDFELKGIEVVGIDKDKLEQDVEEIQRNLALIEKWAAEAQVDEIIKGGLNDLAGTIEEFTGVSGDKFLDFFDKISEGGEKSFTDLAEIASSSFSLAGDVSSAFFQGKIDSYQEDIDANNEYYANLLDNENLSNEERDRLEADRRRKEAQLKKKQAKEKEKQFQVNKLFRIGEIIADTALSIVKIGAQLGVAALPFQIQAGAIGAAQLAIVAAQPTPKFAEGGVMDHDGKMMINDHSSGRLELVERDGKLLMTDKKNAIVDGKKGDIIHKDAEAYFNNQSDEDLIKNLENHSILASMQNNNFLANKLENKKSADNNNYNTDRIVKAIKSQKTKFNVNQNITLADDLSFLGRINDTL